MKGSISLLFLLPAFLSGCAGTTRVLTDTAAAGTGAFAAHKLSRGDALATAAGAGAGVLVSEGLKYAARSTAERARIDGYNKGRSDAVKQQYWIMVNQQKTPADFESEEKISLYEIPIPEQQIDGVTLKPTTRTLRIQE